MAGAERIELPSKVLETPMLPLYHAPVMEQVHYSMLISKMLVFFAYTNLGDISDS